MANSQEIATKALYVENDLKDQRIFQRYVKSGKISLQYDVVSYKEEARKLLVNNYYDIILTDSFFKNEKNIPIIFISDINDHHHLADIITKGACDYLIKDPKRNYLTLLPFVIERALVHKLATKSTYGRDKNSWAIDQITHAITIINKQGYIDWVNKGFENLFGYTIHEAKNKHVRTFRGNDIDEKKLGKIFAYAFKQKNTLTCESRITNKNGKQSWVYTTVTPVIDETNTINNVIIVDTDISEKKKIEHDLIRSKEKAEAAAVMKQQFIANMSHEIRTPINAIMGMMHMLENTEDATTRKKYLQLVNYASNNLLNIINDILDISKLEVGKIPHEKNDFNIIELVSNIKTSMQYRAQEKGLELSCIIDKDVPAYLHGDQARLNQILINLVANALKFTFIGNVTVSLKLLSKTKQTAKLLFTVSDTGIGIAKSAQSHIFQYFHVAHADSGNRDSTGLGLAIVKRLVESQKGKVWFKSEENKGSEFFVELPFELSKKSEKETSGPQILINGPILKDKTVLLVEDEILNQMVAKYLLENDLGASVTSASNGKQAIKMLQAKNFDLVIMDIEMPVMNGYEAAKYIRKKLTAPKNAVPILAMTAHAFTEEELKCKQAGMNGFVSKPFKLDELKQTLNSILLSKKN